MTISKDRLRKEENALLVQKKRVAKLKRELKKTEAIKIGKWVMKTTRVKTLEDFQTQYRIIDRATPETIAQNTPDSNDSQRLSELKQLAEKMTWNGNYWSIPDLKKLSAWLAENFRDDHGKLN